MTTSTIKINKRAILLALLILSAHGINKKQRNVHMLAQDLPSSQKQGVSHKQHNDAYQNISGNEGESLTMTPNWVKPEGHQTDYTRRIPEHEPHQACECLSTIPYWINPEGHKPGKEDTYQNISGNNGESFIMTHNWVKPEGHHTDHTLRLPEHEPDQF